MELEKFSIKDVVLGTKNLSEMTTKFLSNSFNYIETAISYNNDFELGIVLKKNKTTKIISSISSLSQYELMLNYHLTWLKRKKIDILLVDSKASWKDDDLLSLYSRRYEFCDEFGLSNVDSIGDIKRLLDLGIQPDWVSMIINPTYFNLELIEYLKERGIKIISHEILGGYMAQTNIEVYTLQFLLSFAAVYSDLVCISGDSCERVLVNKMILETCKGLEITTEMKSVYIFQSSRIVKRSPLKPLPLYRYLAKGNMILKYKGPMSTYMPALSMESSLETIPEISYDKLNKDRVEIQINDDMEQLILPEDCIPDSMEAFAFWRYNVIALMNFMKGNSGYKYSYECQGNLFLIYRKKRFGFKKDKKSSLYLLAMTDTQTLPIFRKME